MDKKIKIKILSRLVFYIAFIAIWIMLDIDFNDFQSSVFKVAFCGALAWVLSPRVNNFKTQSGDKMQLKWIFSKKVFIL